MKLVFNNLIPVKGYSAMNLFGVFFVRKDSYKEYYENNPRAWEVLLNHESIHTAQMKELGYVFFYIFYILERLFRQVFYPRSAYRGMTFEKEAYANEKDMNYLKTRKHFAQWRSP